MSDIQCAFKRYEKKYLLTPRQFDSVRKALRAHICEDNYGLHTINNIYFDTPDFAMRKRDAPDNAGGKDVKCLPDFKIPRSQRPRSLP